MLVVKQDEQMINIADRAGIKTPNLKNTNRIVINRMSVFEKYTPVCPGSDEAAEYFDDTPRWKKVAGGAGFDPNRVGSCTDKAHWEMTRHIRRVFNKSMETVLYEDRKTRIIRTEPAYRWWDCKGTLNIVRKDLPVNVGK